MTKKHKHAIYKSYFIYFSLPGIEKTFATQGVGLKVKILTDTRTLCKTQHSTVLDTIFETELSYNS
jgi:hypothetical protein